MDKLLVEEDDVAALCRQRDGLIVIKQATRYLPSAAKLRPVAIIVKAVCEQAGDMAAGDDAQGDGL